jgi:hypothetical protein
MMFVKEKEVIILSYEHLFWNFYRICCHDLKGRYYYPIVWFNRKEKEGVKK